MLTYIAYSPPPYSLQSLKPLTMSSKLIPNTFMVRTPLVIVIVILLFLGSALTSGFLAWAAQNDAQAINTAGSIRMATYRVSFLLASDVNNSQQIDELIEDMNYRHNQLQIYQQQWVNKNQRINDQLKRIESRWQKQLQPLLLNKDAQGFYAASLPYIQQVDAVVSQLQHRNEQRQNQQQLLQLWLLTLMMGIMLWAIKELRRKVLTPIKQLMQAKEQFKIGKLDTRVAITGYSEFEALGHSFNDMVSAIEQSHLYLQSEIQSKTAHLTKSNQVLSLLYDFAKYLTTTQVSIVELNRLIADFGKTIPELEFTLCLKSELFDNKDAIAIHSSALRDLCSTLDCDSCLIKTNVYTESFDIRHQKSQYGELRVRPKSLGISRPTSKATLAAQLDPNRIFLVEDKVGSSTKDIAATKALISTNKDAIIALTNLISTAMFLLQQRQQEHQIILLEERATIARELHDSLAQSLSYLKIQVAILEKRLQHTHCDSPDLILVTDSIFNIKEGLTSAYQHLRDLLVTFRLSLNDDSFDEALHNSADEFAEKGGLSIKVNNQVMSLNLSASEQVNVIQIIREALSNVCRHADAKNVQVNFVYTSDTDDVLLTISDDGQGISYDFDQTHHHGLMIMQERAKSLGGKLEITQNEPQGTLVTAQFTPEFFIK